MEYILVLIILISIFCGYTSALYFNLKTLNKKDRKIKILEDDYLNMSNINQQLNFDLSVEIRKSEQKDDLIRKFDDELSKIDDKDLRIKIKELVEDFKGIN